MSCRSSAGRSHTGNPLSSFLKNTSRGVEVEEASKGWDIGELPTVRMAYLEYPEYVPTQFAVNGRDADNVSFAMPKGPSSTDEQARVAVRTHTGWTDYAVLIHSYNTGYPYGYDNDDSTAELAGNTYYPVCITEN